MYNERQREWTPEQMAEAARDAVDNWNWDASTYWPVEDQETVDNQKAILESYTTPEAWAGSAEEDGLIHLDNSYSNVWDYLHERMISEYGAWLLLLQ